MERRNYIAIIKQPILYFQMILRPRPGAVKGYRHFAASTAAGILGGEGGAMLAMTACSIVLGASTFGTGILACGIAGAALGGAAGSWGGGVAADSITGFIFGE